MRQPVPKRSACKPKPYQADQHDQNSLPTPSALEGSRVRKHPVNSHRIGDVLDLAISERFIAANQLVLDLLVNAARNEDLARRGNAFETRSYVDAITVDVVFLYD